MGGPSLLVPAILGVAVVLSVALRSAGAYYERKLRTPAVLEQLRRDRARLGHFLAPRPPDRSLLSGDELRHYRLFMWCNWLQLPLIVALVLVLLLTPVMRR